MSWKKFCELYKVPEIYQNVQLEEIKNVTTNVGKSLKLGILKYVESPFSLILQGDTGRGKTQFMYTLIRTLIDVKGFGLEYFRMINALDIDQHISDQIKLCGSASYFLESLAEVPFLFIDDLGVEGSKERAERNYYSIFDKRLSNKMPTILSTNMNDKEILTSFGSRIESRFKQCIKIIFEGPDLRSPLGSL